MKYSNARESENEVEEINRIIDFLETNTYDLSDEAQNIVNDCIEKLECFKSDNGMCEEC